MLKEVSKTLFIFSTLAGISTQSASAFTYIAKKGDTLSDVLYENDYKPIYGRGGALEQTLKINPDIKYEKGNKIFPGTKIVLSGNIVPGNYVLRSSGKNTVTESVIEKNEPVVIPEAAPVIDHVREVSDIFDQIFFWQLSPSVSWKELTAKDSNINQNSNARALSDMSYGATVVYGMRFNPDVDIYSKLFLEAVNFSSDNSINIVKKNIVTSSLGVGLFYNKKWQVEVGMGDELFLTSPNATSVEIKKVSMPHFKSAYKNEFYQFQEASLLYALSGKVLLPRSAPGIDSKLSYGAGAGIEAKLRNQSFYLGYEKTILKASGNSTDGQNIFWRYTWETP
ncbi:hypothetical protein SHI21_14550 [Bacteriovorax sp. PP10]|uniref:LysM domain-containing protein n=1 Tax=Bacteriovorax antarcticus TaxID=3088717 RepID=A0ABU5VWK8_9BACT|nr:hypothetical protein [Bacteriovorax sp. PP10]MEA9357444.1 hypothetical protein [Bacteriovorax sp. PP10]